MERKEFEAVWQSWADKGDIFEAKPGVWVPIEAVKDSPALRTIFRKLVMAGFIFETTPGQYRVVHPIGRNNHEHRFVCSECGAEA